MRKLKVFLLLLIPITIIAQDNETAPDDKFNIIFSQDFDHHSAPVEYVFALQSPDWNNHTWFDSDHRWPSSWERICPDSIVIDPLTGSKVLKESFSDLVIDGYDCQGADKGGDQWTMRLGGNYHEVYVSSNVQFMQDYDWAGGGKLSIGVRGGTYEHGDGCPPPYGTGFTAETMWHWGDRAGHPYFYTYYPGMHCPYGNGFMFNTFQPTGDGLNYYEGGVADGYFYFDVTESTWYNITIRIVCNTFTGSTSDNNAIMEGYINGRLVARYTGLHLLDYPLRDTEIHELRFRCFNGGGWKPSQNQWIYVDDVFVFTYADGVDVPRGNTQSPPGRVLDLPNLEKVTTVDIDIPTMPVLPDVSIIDVKNTPIPNIAITEAKISSFGQSEIHDYGLTITKSEEPIADELLILASQDNSKIWNTERVSRGLKALYVFDEGEGNQVLDNSGIDPPVNLEIQNPSVTKWLAGRGLKVEGNTIILTKDVPTELINSITSTNEITLETWIKSADINQSGPARIISLSKDPLQRAFTLGQEGNHTLYNYIARLNTTSTDANGLPNVYTDNVFYNLNLHHVVYTRKSNGEEKIYVNGQECYTGMRGGDFSSMGNDYYLSIANEISGDRPWIGTYYLLAIYNQALNKDEINMNFTAGLGEIRFTTNLLVEPNVTYLVTPFARSDQGVIYGSTEVLRPWSNTSVSPFEENLEPYHGVDR